MTDLLDGLNPQQREAVTAIEGPVLVLAGPGSGKTRVLTHRIAYLVKVAGIEPYSIVAVTFTNKAAREMRTRLEQLLGNRAEGVTLGTFHAICARILRRSIHHLGYENSFVIYDTDDQRRLVKQIIIQDLNLNEKTYRPAAVQAAISRAKNELLTPEAMEKNAASYWETVAARVYARYQERLQQANALDFDDLLLLTVRLLREVPAELERLRRRWHFLHIDEFQDTNMPQYELVRLLGETHRNVFVVGDIDQSIYSWRGADYRNVLRFEQDFPERRTILLEQNYRSTQTILDAAQAVIRRNRHRKPLKLWTDKGRGQPIVLHEAYDEVEEAQFVVREIRNLVRQGAARYADIAVMYRTNAQSRALEEAFVRSGVPYVLVGGTRFYERREVKDLLAYMRLIHNPFDAVSMERVINVPPRGIGARTWETLVAWANQLGVPVYTALQVLAASREGVATEEDEAVSPFLPDIPPPFGTRAANVLVDFYTMLRDFIRVRHTMNAVDLLEAVIRRINYREYVDRNLSENEDDAEERWANVQELLAVADQFSYADPAQSLPNFLEEVALVSDADTIDENRDVVTLLTLHTAKGLEYKVVFITGVEENLLPHSRSTDEIDALDEERRLFYVGITRAKERLYLLYAFRRQTWGGYETRQPSRFLRDIPAELLATPRKSAPRQGTLGIGRTTASRPRPSSTRSPHDARLQQRKVERQETARAEKASLSFAAGDRVRHPKFGEGVVISSTRTRSGDEEVTVAFEAEGIKKLLASFAKLEKIAK
ncbi:DNA helicase II / ATP-dependent DNA helicase PcrA [Ardenticatena maritima]|uniref:DNA 3'-5' helicase n=1 Tax=Ardenticatena maritima TaxID=872965 RepID=A0A0M8K876_9CHLR|nr:UvrD-helicase domain-containing protein [Ardenticatena maritima]KPL89430.1 hypothetical protein SE16_02995 [Ardenticatena maritima]GAP62459.1 DNA helicase II / ATP-dependent DNA helicase PcrA [Ardenticatena maritima]